jgi:hypothetical protein
VNEEFEKQLDDFILSRFGHLIGKIIVDNSSGKEIEITDKYITKAVRKLVGYRRRSYDISPKDSDEFVIDYVDDQTGEKIITEQNVIDNIPSVVGLKNGVQQKEVKFDDVRNMPLGFNNLESYTEAEKLYIQQRLYDFDQDFELKTAADKFIAWRAILCEMNIMQLELYKIHKPKEATETQKQIDTLDNQYKKHCDALNVLKKQRDNSKEKPKDQGTDLTSAINQLDKSISDMKLEVEEEKKQEQEMIKKLSKKTKKDIEDLL